MATVYDADNNAYEEITIGKQVWLDRNMLTTKYPDGSDITKGPSSDGASGWDTDEGYYSCPPNSSNDGEDCSAADSLGMLYQWSAAMNGSTSEEARGIAPYGFHIPSDEEIKVLEGEADSTYGIGDSEWDDEGWIGDDAGSALADHATDEDWSSGGLTSNSRFAATDFKAPPSGYRGTNGSYYLRSNYVFFWSSTGSGSSAWRRRLYYNNSTVSRYDGDKAHGFSVRCLKNAAVTQDATNIDFSSATLVGDLGQLKQEYGNSSLDFYFEWGTDDSYGNTTDQVNKTDPENGITADITGLSAQTEYHYRAVATDGTNTWYGEDVTFETPLIKGQVTLSGTGVENAKVFLINDTDGTVEATTTTDSDGNYSFYEQTGKTYHIAVQYDDGSQKYNAKSKPYLET